MSSVAITGIGTLLRRWSGSAWVNMSEVVEIDGPKKSRDTIEVTHLGSTDGYKDYIGGLRDGGVTELGLGITAKDAIVADVSIKISGEVTTNSGASSGLTS